MILQPELTVNDKKANRPRYWVTYLLKNLGVGETFSPDLLHLTIVPWFVVDLEKKEVGDSFTETFGGESKFEATVGEQDEFNQNRRIPINFIKPNPAVQQLHSKALDWLSSMDVRWAVKNPHVGHDYIPHIRRRDGRSVSEGDTLLIDSLSLVRAHRRGDDFRIVAAKVKFQ